MSRTLCVASASKVVLLISLALAAPVAAQRTITPGDPSLKPTRVRLGTDTLALLVTPRDSAEHLSSVLIRSIARVDGPDGPMFRETQRYESHEPARPRFSYDTLDVDARTLQVIRSFFAGGGSTHDVRISDLQIDGTTTTPDSGTRAVHVTAQEPFFDSMMQESFVAAFPFAEGTTLSIPMINPPNATVRTMKFDVARRETIRTADGPEPCLVVTSANGNVQFWVSTIDGRLMRLHWLANGASIWKLPLHDADFR